MLLRWDRFARERRINVFHHSATLELWSEHAHDYAECMVVLGGRGRHRVGGAGGREDELTRGMVVTIRPGIAHRAWSEPGVAVSLVNIALPYAACAALARRGGPWSAPVCAERLEPEAAELLGAIALRVRLNDVRDRDWLLLSLDRLWPVREARAPPAWIVAEAERMIEDGLAPRVATLARRCRLHPDSLSRLLRRATGEPAGAWLLRRRLELARGELRDRRFTVAAVAARLGFASAAHFTRAFAAAFGRPPGAWRRGDG